jgi:hypothetical protein
MRLETEGWARQVTIRELGVSKDIAGVNMRLNAGGVRELHWHKAAVWAYMLYGTARITAVDAEGRSFVNDVGLGDLLYFASGNPHSIQGLGYVPSPRCITSKIPATCSCAFWRFSKAATSPTCRSTNRCNFKPHMCCVCLSDRAPTMEMPWGRARRVPVMKRNPRGA